MSWSSAPNLSAVNGKMVIEINTDGSIKGSSISNPNQRIIINNTFTGDAIDNNKISFKVQTPAPEIIQEYELIIINKNHIKGTIKNVAIKPTNRPAYWDIPEEIELTR